MPKCRESLNATLWWVTRNDGGIDGTDRHTHNPVGLECRVGQFLIRTRLIRTQRTPTLQYQCNAIMGSVHAGGAAIGEPSNFQCCLRQVKCCAVFSDVVVAIAVNADALLYATSSLSSAGVTASHCVNKLSNSSSTKGLPR